MTIFACPNQIRPIIRTHVRLQFTAVFFFLRKAYMAFKYWVLQNHFPVSFSQYCNASGHITLPSTAWFVICRIQSLSFLFFFPIQSAPKNSNNYVQSIIFEKDSVQNLNSGSLNKLKEHLNSPTSEARSQLKQA